MNKIWGLKSEVRRQKPRCGRMRVKCEKHLTAKFRQGRTKVRHKVSQRKKHFISTTPTESEWLRRRRINDHEWLLMTIILYLEWKGLRPRLGYIRIYSLWYLFYIPWMKRIETGILCTFTAEKNTCYHRSILYTLNEKDWDDWKVGYVWILFGRLCIYSIYLEWKGRYNC